MRQCPTANVRRAAEIESWLGAGGWMSDAGRLSGGAATLGTAVVILCAAWTGPTGGVRAAEESPLVKEVAVENVGAGSIDRTFVFEHITTGTNRPLDRREIAGDVRALMDTRAFSSVRVDAEEVDGGYRIIYELRNKYRLAGPVKVVFDPKKDSYYGESKIADWIGLEAGGLVDDQDLGVAARRIEKEYADRHFPDTRVEWEISERDREAGLADVTVTVHEGKRARVKRLVFTGNEQVPEKELRSASKERSWYDPRAWFGGARYNPDELEIKRTAVKEVYLRKGFLDVDVAEPLAGSLEGGGLEVVIGIREGVGYRFGPVGLAGVTLFPEADLQSLVSAKQGDVASADALKETARAVRDYYGRRGYIRTEVSPALNPDPNRGIVDVVFTVVEGRLTTIRNIRIQGNTTTRDKVIRRELMVNPGDVFDEVRVRRSENIIGNLGYFSDVRSYPLSTDVPGEDDLMLEVEEKPTGQFLLGVGFSSIDRASGWVELSQGNFDLLGWPQLTGGGQKLKLSAMLGSKSRQYRLNFKEPWFMDRPLSLGFELYRDEREYNDYDIKRTGGRVSVDKRLPGAGNRISFRYGLEQSEVTDVSDTNIYHWVDSPDEEFWFMRDEKTTKSTLGATLMHRTYNHPFIPTRGDSVSLAADVSGGPFGADLDIYELSLDLGHYEPLWLKHVLKLSANYAVVDSYGNTGEVPLSERLFLGGGRTLRGFDYRAVGPKVVRQSGSGTIHKSAGGSSRAMASAEYTIPLVSAVRFAVFYDIGNVWRDPYEFDPGDLASSAGVGVRLDFPGFPIRLDWGWPIERDDEYTGADRFSLWIGVDY